jgi:hypothetical protein
MAGFSSSGISSALTMLRMAPMTPGAVRQFIARLPYPPRRELTVEARQVLLNAFYGAGTRGVKIDGVFFRVSA